jgi:hypothetical protein
MRFNVRICARHESLTREGKRFVTHWGDEMHVFLICDFDGPVVIDFGRNTTDGCGQANGEGGDGAPELVLVGASRQMTCPDVRISDRWRRCLARLASGITTLVTVRPIEDRDIPVVETGASGSA